MTLLHQTTTLAKLHADKEKTLKSVALHQLLETTLTHRLSLLCTLIAPTTSTRQSLIWRHFQSFSNSNLIEILFTRQIFMDENNRRSTIANGTNHSSFPRINAKKMHRFDQEECSTRLASQQILSTFISWRDEEDFQLSLLCSVALGHEVTGDWATSSKQSDKIGPVCSTNVIINCLCL